MGILGTGLQDGLLLKPIRYQWAMDLYDQAVANTWFPNEIQLGEDIADFKKMTAEERHAVTFLMSYFNPNALLLNHAHAYVLYPSLTLGPSSLYPAVPASPTPTTPTSTASSSSPRASCVAPPCNAACSIRCCMRANVSFLMCCCRSSAGYGRCLYICR